MKKFKRKHILVLCVLLSSVGFMSVLNDGASKKLANTERFSVINVQGRIIFKSSGADMKRGDVYVTGTKLNFATNDARAAIVNPNKGRLILTGNTKGKIKVLPAANNISSRSGALLNIMDLKKHFSDRYLILKRSEVQISKQSFPMNRETFFYLTYEHNGEEIAKKLRNEDDFLILDKEEIYKVDGKSIPYEEKEMTLYYRKDGKGLKINTFTPVFPDNEELKAEVKMLLDGLGEKEEEEQIKEVTSYLNDFYGNPHKNNLRDWLKSEFKLEKK